MEFKDDHYELFYDYERLKQRSEAYKYYGGIDTIQVPQLKDIDPERMGIIYGIAKNKVSLLSDFEIIVDQDFYSRRSKGELPKLMIGEDQFFINGHHGVLEQKDGMFNMIKMSDMAYSHDGKLLQFFYDSKNKVLYEPPEDLVRLPKDVLFVTIPHVNTLDPFSVARKMDLNIKSHLMQHQPRETHTATIVPLEKSWLKSEVDYNRKRIKEQRQESHNTSQKRKK